MLDVHLKGLRQENYKAAARLAKKCVTRNSSWQAWPHRQIVDFLSSQAVHGRGFGAWIGDQLIGAIFYSEYDDGYVLLDDIFVHPSRRRQKVGSQLMTDLALRTLEDHKRFTIDTACPDNETAAHLFLRHCQFKLSQVIRKQDGTEAVYAFTHEADYSDMTEESNA